MAEQAPEYPEPRFYSREFKLEAVRPSETTEKSVAQIARELGVRERVLYRWRRQLREQPEQAFPGLWTPERAGRRDPPLTPRAGAGATGAGNAEKNSGYLLARPAMRYAVIAGYSGEYPLSVLCQTVEVSVSGYSAWCKRMPSRHQQVDEALAAEIQHAFMAGRRVYGSPRVHAWLRHHGIRCSRKRVARLMRLPGLCAARQRRRKPRTTDSQHAYPIAPNLLEHNFAATAPNRTWVADITAIETQEGWLYLSGIVDTYSRRAIGYAMATRRDEALVETALEMALCSRRPQAGLVHHSDRGSQYTSWGYRAMVDGYGIVLSMSGKGDPYDNDWASYCTPSVW